MSMGIVTLGRDISTIARPKRRTWQVTVPVHCFNISAFELHFAQHGVKLGSPERM